MNLRIYRLKLECASSAEPYYAEKDVEYDRPKQDLSLLGFRGFELGNLIGKDFVFFGFLL